MDSDFWSFRKMITPTVIQVIFILGLIAVVVGGLGMMFSGIGFMGFLSGLLFWVLGAIMVRVYCELVILFFRIYDELKAIREGRPPTDQGFPVVMPAAPATPPPPVAPAQ
jgi:hypothetical protein